MVLRLDVVNEVPAASEAPPVEAAHQLMVPADAAAPSVTVPGPQWAPGVVLVIVGNGVTLKVAAVVVAEGEQVPEITH